EGFELLIRTLQDLANEIFRQAEIVACDVEQRDDVFECQRRQQVRKFTMLEEAGREARIRAEQQRIFAADDACVEMRHRHRRGTYCRFAINLGMVAMTDRVDVAAQPDAADWGTAITVAFGDLPLLQQRPGAPPRPTANLIWR